MKWVSKDNKKKYSIKRFFSGFKYAFSGIKQALKTEQNFLFDIIIGILAVILGYFLKLNATEFAIVLLTIGLVISMELMNSAIEYTVDLSMPKKNPLAKSAKDIAAAAVLISAIIAIIVGIFIYLPKIIELV